MSMKLAICYFCGREVGCFKTSSGCWICKDCAKSYKVSSCSGQCKETCKEGKEICPANDEEDKQIIFNLDNLDWFADPDDNPDGNGI